VTAWALTGAIDLYQATLSPLMPRIGVQCRFRPSCSRYAEAAIHKHGALRGTAKAAWRIARCGPWTPAGTVDEP
jgi:putative membrane protein insertion efficiency factor